MENFGSDVQYWEHYDQTQQKEKEFESLGWWQKSQSSHLISVLMTTASLLEKPTQNTNASAELPSI